MRFFRELKNIILFIKFSDQRFVCSLRKIEPFDFRDFNSLSSPWMYSISFQSKVVLASSFISFLDNEKRQTNVTVYKPLSKTYAEVAANGTEAENRSDSRSTLKKIVVTPPEGNDLFETDRMVRKTMRSLKEKPKIDAHKIKRNGAIVICNEEDTDVQAIKEVIKSKLNQWILQDRY